MSDQMKSEVYEDEIDLFEIFAVLWRRKWLIAAITIAVGIVGAIHSFSKENLYTVSVSVSPNILKYDAAGNPHYVDSIANFKARVDGGIYSRVLASRSEDGWLPMISVGENGQFNEMVISSNVIKERVDLTKVLLGSLINLLNEDYESRISYELQSIEKAKEAEQEKLAMLELEISELLKEEKYLLAENESIAGSMADLMAQRDRYVKRNPSVNEGTALMYLTAIQQNRDYLNQIRNQLKQVRSQLLVKKNELQNMQQADDVQEAVNDQVAANDIEQNENEQITALVMLEEPAAAINPIPQNEKRNLLLAIMVGLMLGVFAAFIAEFVANARKCV